MTQERKDELYDLMIAWICEHNPNNEDLFHVLTEDFGMTQEELHDHCIESLDEFFPEGTDGYYDPDENAAAGHDCPYCGAEAEGSDEDLLCSKCRELFGHAFFSEL